MNVRKVALVLAAASLVAGCYFPEKFDSTITVKADQSYNVKFTGTVVNLMYLVGFANSKKKHRFGRAFAHGLARREKTLQAPTATSGRYFGFCGSIGLGLTPQNSRKIVNRKVF